jgi:predicted PurR-regulated permease PerM
MATEYKKYPFYHKLAAVLVSLIAIGYIVIQGKSLLSPLIFSCLFSILLLPLGSFLERKFHLKRALASMISVILLLATVATIIYIVAVQLTSLSDDWPQFKTQLNSSQSELQHWIAREYHINSSKQLTLLKSASGKVLDSGTAVLGETIISISSLLLFAVFTFIYTFFFLNYRRLIMHFLITVFLEENSSLVHDIIEQVQKILRKYITGLFIEMCVVATAVCLVLWALGIKYAILLGLITGLLNIIPYIGIFTAMLISVLITFATAATAGKVLLVLITLIVTHLVDSNILLPVIVGSKVKINPLITVLGVVIGEMFWGISGMFLSIPVIAVLKIIFDKIESMKAWGILLGEEAKTVRQRKSKQGKLLLDE